MGRLIPYLLSGVQNGSQDFAFTSQQGEIFKRLVAKFGSFRERLGPTFLREGFWSVTLKSVPLLERKQAIEDGSLPDSQRVRRDRQSRASCPPAFGDQLHD